MLVFDIESFCPSISEKLFNGPAQYAKNIEIPDHDIIIINHSRKPLLFHEIEPLVKKEGNENFDVYIWKQWWGGDIWTSWLIMLSKLEHLFQDSSVEIYRDDGLGVLRDLSGPETEWLRKNVVKTFKDCGLSITSKTNLKIFDYLYVTFDLQNNRYKPYRTPDI